MSENDDTTELYKKLEKIYQDQVKVINDKREHDQKIITLMLDFIKKYEHGEGEDKIDIDDIVPFFKNILEHLHDQSYGLCSAYEMILDLKREQKLFADMAMSFMNKFDEIDKIQDEQFHDFRKQLEDKKSAEKIDKFLERAINDSKDHDVF